MDWTYLTRTGKRYWQYLGLSFVLLFIYYIHSSFVTLNEIKDYRLFLIFYVIFRGPP